MCSIEYNWHYVSIASGNDLALIGRQAIICTSGGLDF